MNVKNHFHIKVEARNICEDLWSNPIAFMCIALCPKMIYQQVGQLGKSQPRIKIRGNVKSIVQKY